MKWEYKTLTSDFWPGEVFKEDWVEVRRRGRGWAIWERVQELGAEGWKLVGLGGYEASRFYFKRPLAE